MAQKRLKNFGIQNPLKEVRSDSIADQTYVIHRDAEGATRCTCMGNQMRKTCKHVNRYMLEELGEIKENPKKGLNYEDYAGSDDFLND